MNVTCFTFPSPTPGQGAWVNSPACRGTSNIAQLCFSTTFVCIYTSVHRDIPFKRLSRTRSLQRDAPFVLVALFAPELMFYFAFNQYICARSVFHFSLGLQSFKVPSDEGQKDLSKIKRLLRLFGLRRDTPSGVESDVQLLDNMDTRASASQKGKIIRQNRFTLVHGFYATMGGFAFFQPKGFAGEGQCCKLTAAGVKFFMKYEPDLIPDLSRTLIMDRSKYNGLGKALLVVQVFWFCLNGISRLAERLPLSLLEVSTLAHGLFTLSSYVMWWSKPLSIEEPTWISMDGEGALEAFALSTITNDAHFGRLEQYEILENTIQDQSSLPPESPQILTAAWKAAKRYGITTEELSTIRDTFFNPVSFVSVPKFRDLFNATGLAQLSSFVLFRVTDYVVMTCIPIIYGFVHYLALREHFPAAIEQDLWRIACVVVMTAGAVAALVDFIDDFCVDGPTLSESSKQRVRRSIDIVHYRIIPFFYVLGSGYLLVVSNKQLLYLPPEAYVVASWSYYFPHWF